MQREASDGYVQDIGYAHTYFHELAPSTLRFHLLVNGHGCASDGRSYTHCELGYGQGVSANLHAASNARGDFWGTDFNAAHAVNAQNLARDAGLKAHWLDLSFEALLDAGTPSFDFIVLHGIWSWVGPGVQHALVEFLRRKLNPGGVVFISYNIVPGWNAEKPLRDLLWLHAEITSGAEASTTARMAGALEFAQALRRHGSAFFRGNPAASHALDDMIQQDTASLAHEHFNSAWNLTYFNHVQQALQAANLEFGCSLHISDVSGEVRERIAGASFLDGLDGSMRETAADFVLNRRFRRDVFVRGAPRLSPAARLEKLDEVRFTLMRPAAQVPAAVATPYGKAVLDEKRLRPLLAMLEAAPDAVSFAQLRTSSELQPWTAEEILGDLSTLVARRDICPVFADDLSARDGRTHAMNLAIAKRSAPGDVVRYLASPVAGAAVDANSFERAFWLCWHNGARGVGELARSAGALLSGEPQRQEGLEARAAQFLMITIPIWKKLGLLDEVKP
jgi:SAM-dependent methyltransferase